MSKMIGGSIVAGSIFGMAVYGYGVESIITGLAVTGVGLLAAFGIGLILSTGLYANQRYEISKIKNEYRKFTESLKYKIAEVSENLNQ